jgi:hypothetical protein
MREQSKQSGRVATMFTTLAFSLMAFRGLPAKDFSNRSPVVVAVLPLGSTIGA